MNTVLGVIMIVANGQLVGALEPNAYPSVDVCKEDLHARARALNTTPDQQIAIFCHDFADEIEAHSQQVRPKIKN